jgi:hypothetical protein
MFKQYFSFLKLQWQHYLRQKNIIYRIVEIDAQHNIFSLQIKGRNLLIKKDFFDTISTENLVQNMSALDASSVGFYCGRLFYASKSSSENPEKNSFNFPFALTHQHGRYELIGQDLRTQEITYIDKVNSVQFKELPTAVIQSDYIINKFDPTQACYIGVLAGRLIEKTIARDKTPSSKTIEKLLQKKPQLRVIK